MTRRYRPAVARAPAGTSRFRFADFEGSPRIDSAARSLPRRPGGGEGGFQAGRDRPRRVTGGEGLLAPLVEDGIHDPEIGRTFPILHRAPFEPTPPVCQEPDSFEGACASRGT